MCVTESLYIRHIHIQRAVYVCVWAPCSLIKHIDECKKIPPGRFLNISGLADTPRNSRTNIKNKIHRQTPARLQLLFLVASMERTLVGFFFYFDFVQSI